MGPRPDALNAAIDEAWRVFDLPAPDRTGVCVHCCMDPVIEAQFLKTQARELPAKFVQDWYSAAYDDSIDHDHVAWFLPRVMEMLADGEEVSFSGHQVVFSRLALAGFPERWSAREVATLDRFAKAFFSSWLAKRVPHADPELDGWLCMFGEGGFNVSSLLARLDHLPENDLVDILHRSWVFPNRREIQVSPFWSDSPARRLVWEWYTSDALLARLTKAMLAGSEQAVDLYDLIVAARGG